MRVLTMSEKLQAKLGQEKVEKLVLLKGLSEKLAASFETSKDISPEMSASIANKIGRLKELFEKIEAISLRSHRSNDVKAEKINAEIEQLLGGDIDAFKKKLVAEIEATEKEFERREKEIETEMTVEVAQVEEEMVARVDGDVELLKQEKQELFEKRDALIKKRDELDKKYDKALVAYNKRNGIFGRFVASVKSIFGGKKDSQEQQMEQQRAAELAQMHEELTEIENEIVTVSDKIVGLSEQRKAVKGEIIKEHQVLAEAVSEHLEDLRAFSRLEADKALDRSIEVELEQRELARQELENGKSDELTRQREAIVSEVEAAKKKWKESLMKDLVARKRTEADFTVEDILAVVAEKRGELMDQLDVVQDSEKAPIQQKIAELDMIYDDLVNPIIEAEREQIPAKEPAKEEAVQEVTQPEVEEPEKPIFFEYDEKAMVAERIEKLKEQLRVAGKDERAFIEEELKSNLARKAELEKDSEKEEKTLTTQELVDKYERDREGMKYVVELKIKEVEEALEQCDSRRRRAKLERELDVLKKKKEEYEKPLGRRTAVQQAKRHYGMDR